MSVELALISLRDQELIALLRDEPLRSVVDELRRADLTYHVPDEGPVLGSEGLRVGRRSWRATERILRVGGREGGFPRVAAAVEQAAWARGWAETPCRHALRLPREAGGADECRVSCVRALPVAGDVCPPGVACPAERTRTVAPSVAHA